MATIMILITAAVLSGNPLQDFNFKKGFNFQLFSELSPSMYYSTITTILPYYTGIYNNNLSILRKALNTNL